jgi:endoglucanase
MYRTNGQIFAFATAATCLGLACAADAGDPQKAAIALGGGSSSSSSSSSGSSTSSSSSGSGSGSSSSSSGSGSGSSNSSSSSSSSGAVGGDDGGLDAPATGPSCAAGGGASAPVVSYYTDDTDPTKLAASNQIGFHFQIVGGVGPLSLSDLTVRYWFTVDSDALSSLFFVSYYSQNGNTTITPDVSAAFVAAPAGNVTATSDSYIELSFTAAAGGLSFGTSAQIQVVVHGPGANGYSDVFNETNDYSYVATTGQTYQASDRITAYVKGQLVSGCEPGAAAAGN